MSRTCSMGEKSRDLGGHGKKFKLIAFENFELWHDAQHQYEVQAVLLDCIQPSSNIRCNQKQSKFIKNRPDAIPHSNVVVTQYDVYNAAIQMTLYEGKLFGQVEDGLVLLTTHKPKMEFSNLDLFCVPLTPMPSFLRFQAFSNHAWQHRVTVVGFLYVRLGISRKDNPDFCRPLELF